MWSTILLLGSAHGLVVATLLLRAARAGHHRSSNRCLAALLVSVVLLITPYTIGYAGFYDRYPWLSFAPFDWRFAFGPLIYFYVRQLFRARLPPRWRWHFAAAALQGTYYAVVFCTPLSFKNAWDAHVHVPWVVPFETWGGYLSLGAYWLAATRQYRRSQRWLEDHSAAREEYRLHWLRGFLVALAVMVGLQLGFDLVEVASVHLTYYDRFPLYLAFTALVYFLGIEGWRNADRAFPQLDVTPARGEPAPGRAAGEPARLDAPAGEAAIAAHGGACE
jgi:hypothetical protein